MCIVNNSLYISIKMEWRKVYYFIGARERVFSDLNWREFVKSTEVRNEW